VLFFYPRSRFFRFCKKVLRGRSNLLPARPHLSFLPLRVMCTPTIDGDIRPQRGPPRRRFLLSLFLERLNPPKTHLSARLTLGCRGSFTRSLSSFVGSVRDERLLCSSGAPINDQTPVPPAASPFSCLDVGSVLRPILLGELFGMAL